MIWKPHVTVATIAERDGRFLIVEESPGDQRRVLNQPAGHLEQGESLLQAAVRETLEESAWHFDPEGVVGLYRWSTPEGRTYLRVTLCGTVRDHQPERPLDPTIHRALWMSREALAAAPERLRSPMVLRCIDDYLDGHRYPLTLLMDLDHETPR